MQPRQGLLFADPEEIFRLVHRNLFPRKPVPPVRVLVRPYANANSSIRLNAGGLEVKIADLLEGAPEEVLFALATILITKLYRQRPPRDALQLYREWIYAGHVRGEINQARKARGRKYVSGAAGVHYHLDPLFDRLNLDFFQGRLAKPRLGWSRRASRTLLGHFDPIHNAIVLSRILDRPSVPELAVEYVLFHEMLHLLHPVEHRAGRRCVHTPAFREAEKAFPRIQEAKALLRQL